VPQLSVAENVFLGRLPVKGFGSVDRRALRAAAEKTLRNCGYSISPSEIVGELPIAKQQMVEVARAMTFPFSIVIFDEPTAALTDAEAELLFENIRRLKEQNVAIVYVTHKMKEVFALADRITVLRDGRNRGTLERRSTTEDHVISLMIGRQLDQYFEHAETKPGPEVVRVKNLSVPGFVSNVSFSIRAGEILGLYGLVGSGRSELAEAIFGLRAKTGKVFISGKEAGIHSAKDAVDLGIGLVPEDRKRQGLILQLGAQDKIALALLRRLSAGGFTRPKRESDREDPFVHESSAWVLLEYSKSTLIPPLRIETRAACWRPYRHLVVDAFVQFGRLAHRMICASGSSRFPVTKCALDLEQTERVIRSTPAGSGQLIEVLLIPSPSRRPQFVWRCHRRTYAPARHTGRGTPGWP
jgi:ABC-type sugar transport system ATPase subunit